MDLTGIVPESWLTWITLGVTVCAAITTVLPTPKDGGSALYRAVYRLIQWVALNVGKAKNAAEPDNPLYVKRR